MTKYIFPILIFTLVSCSDNEPTMPEVCTGQELEVISDGKSCADGNGFLICERIEIEETQFIDEDARIWTPDICDFELGDEISFRHENSTTAFRVVDLNHYIAKERIHVSCNENYEMSTFICQENELIAISFLSTLLGPDTLTLELRTKTVTYEGQKAGKKRNIIGFWSDSHNTNVRNFWINHTFGEDYYEQIWQSYNESLTLNGNVYKDVLAYEFGENIHAPIDERYYMQKGVGILGFEVNGKLWLRE